MTKYDKNNCECPDKTPVEIPLGYTAPETLESMIARLVTAHDFRAQLAAQGVDTIEEAEDFDVNDDTEIKSEHEMVDMLDEFIQERIMPAAQAPIVPETQPEIPATK